MSSSLTSLSRKKAGPPSELLNHCVPCTMCGAWNMASTQHPYDTTSQQTKESMVM